MTETRQEGYKVTEECFPIVTEELVEECFPISEELEKILKLVEEYKSLRWYAFYGVMSAIQRISEIDDEIKELGVPLR
jgi:hypothetical protein